jgi:hypothetical protein
MRAIASGATLYNRGSYGLRYRKHYDSLTAHPDLMDGEVAFDRLRQRYPHFFSDTYAASESPAPALNKHGWKRLLTGDPRRETGLVVLPEQICDSFIDKLNRSIDSLSAPLVVLSTCQMETYPAEFLDSLCGRRAEMFSLPDFLEDHRELWLEFIVYLSQSRIIKNVWYGQNVFFVDNLPSISPAYPNASFNYISRYTVSQQLPNSADRHHENAGVTQ